MPDRPYILQEIVEEFTPKASDHNWTLGCLRKNVIKKRESPDVLDISEDDLENIESVSSCSSNSWDSEINKAKVIERKDLKNLLP